jgi:hypothetical protein
MTAPMISNLKKLEDQVTGSDPEDPTLYQQIIGSLMYLVHTRPDICYAVNALSQFMCEPKHIHMVAVKHILRYVVNVYAIIIVLCISIDKSIIRTRSLRNTHSQETRHLSWETL